MYILDIQEALSFLNSNKMNSIEYCTIYCGTGSDSINPTHRYFESLHRAMIDINISNNKPYEPHIYIDGSYSGLYWNYFEDLQYEEGLMIDDIYYPFILLEVVE